MILLKNKDKKANIKIGNNIEIKDGSDFPFDLTLYGKSTQATRSGKNLLNPNGASQNGSGLTFTNNGDGSFTVEGTSTANLSLVLSTQKIKLNANQPYTQSITTVSGTKTGEVVVSVKNSSDKITFNYIAGNQTITPTEDLTTHTYTYYVASGKTVNWTFKVQLEKGSTATDYEPYGVMPSPDYPSPIESVGRKNLFDVTLDDSITNEIQYKTYMLKPNTKYTISTNTYLSNDVIANIFIDLGTSLTPITSTNGVKGSKTIITDSTGYVTIGYRNYSMQLDYSTGMYYCQLEKGTVVTDYVPYEHTEISATVTGKNLISTTIFNANNYISQLLHLKVGNYTIKYTGDISSAIYVRKNDGTTPINGTVVIEKYNLNTMTFSISEEGLYYIQFYKSGTGFANFENAQLEEGSTATDYEPYQSNTLTIDLQGNELCSLPNGTKDEVNITNGEALLIKKIRHITRAIADMNNSDAYPGWTNETQLKEDYPNKNDSFSIAGINIRSNITNDAKYIGLNTNASGTLMLFKNLFNNMTQTEIKANYPDLVLDLYYELAEPETINLGTVEMPHTYEGVSNITNSADTEMVVKYYKKFEFDKILRSGYNIDEQEYEIAKKQMANGKRKKILSSYVDCIIKIDLGLLDNKTYQEYKEQLEDGEYEYWSYKYNQYKKANFILTKPSITTEYAYDDEIGIDDMEITLEKSSDVS